MEINNKRMKNRVFLLLSLFSLVFAGCTSESVDPGDVSRVNIEMLGKPGTDSVRLKFVPDEGSAFFEYAIGDDIDYEAFDNGTMEGIVTVEGDAPVEVMFPDLVPATVYTVYARAYSASGQSEGVNVFKFTTEDDRFKVEIQYLLDKSAGIILSFPQEYVMCRYMLGKAEDRQSFVDGTAEDIKTVSEIDNIYVLNYFTLEPSTEYVFYAIGTDRLGYETDLFEIPFETFASDECPNAEISADIDVFSGKYVITPNDKCGKVIGHVEFTGNSDGKLSGWNNDVMNMIYTWADFEMNDTYSEMGKPLEMVFNTPDMLNDYALDVFVIVCDDQMYPKGVIYKQYKTPAFDSSLPLPVPVEVSVSDITEKGATYHFNADESILGYMYETVEADWYDDIVKNDAGWYEDYLADIFFKNGKYFHYGTGEHSFIETNGYSNFRYYAAAVSMNGNGPRKGGWGKVTLVDYTTK